MATFLVLAKDLPNAGRVEGDPVSVKPDGFQWSIEEDIRRWTAAGNDAADFPNGVYVIDCTGLPLDRGRRAKQHRIRSAHIADPSFLAPDPADRVVEIERHRWTFDPDNLAPPFRNLLRSQRFLVISRGFINGWVRDRSGRDVLDTNTPVDIPEPSGGAR